VQTARTRYVEILLLFAHSCPVRGDHIFGLRYEVLSRKLFALAPLRETFCTRVLSDLQSSTTCRD
jgi:hypothetical protein